MRHRAAIVGAGLGVAGLGGCAPDCPPASAADGVWQVYANPVRWSIGGEDFPGRTPANGESTWDLAFDAPAGTVAIAIDGQPFEGEAAWDEVECGRFSLHVIGTYAAAGGSTHAFETIGQMLTFGETLEGTWTWSEAWASADGARSGSFSTQGQVAGVRATSEE